ncbi:MAG TPA: phosphoenolpyruvate carboxylase [Thermoleophilaceae bacterium]|nr:phosphoenolpyruvate carboxylase [Thermoleophilaceae bacterium]
MTPGETLRVPAALLQEVCRVLLPRYAAARREPERMALLTTACLERGAGSVAGDSHMPNGDRHGRAPADPFEQIARAVLLHGEPAGGTLFVTDTEHASDVLCALWLARRSGLFQPGSSTAEASGKRSHLEIVPAFAARVSPEAAAAAMAGLYANAAFRRHLEARGRARMVALAAAAA